MLSNPAIITPVTSSERCCNYRRSAGLADHNPLNIPQPPPSRVLHRSRQPEQGGPKTMLGPNVPSKQQYVMQPTCIYSVVLDSCRASAMSDHFTQQAVCNFAMHTERTTTSICYSSHPNMSGAHKVTVWPKSTANGVTVSPVSLLRN
jgi:hypothetical protein